MNKILIFLVKFYKLFISPHLQPSCRFLPSCSTYAIEALQKHGAIKGTRLTLKRLLKCHPFSKNPHQGVFDPVPDEDVK